MNKPLQETFGIIITCYIGDYFLTKGLLASLNHFVPHIPICLIQDGDFSIESEKKAYNIQHVIKRKDVKDDFLRENCFGSRCTNMIAFWESPFDRFFYIDSDTIVWGDILKGIEFSQFDFIHNSPHELYTDFIIQQQYLNYKRLFKHIKSISIKDHHFFNAGVFIARKGIFSLEQYKELFALWKSDKKLFGPEPQGFINYMVFRYAEEGILKIHETALQTIVPIFGKEVLQNRFANVSQVDKPTVIHWAGKKPLFLNRKIIYSDIALQFRKQNLRDIKSIAFLFSTLTFWIEENKNLLRIYFKGSVLKYIQSKCKQIYTLKLRRLLKRISWKLFPKNQVDRLKKIKEIKCLKKYPQVDSIDKTINQIVNERKSIARFGDGEFNLCYDRSIAFQSNNLQLRYRLKSILGFVGNKHCLIAIPDFNPDDVTSFWINSWYENIQEYQELLNPTIVYPNAGISRQSSLDQIIKLSKAWENRNVIFVYGEKGRFVMGHPIFSKIKSYFEILAPAQNAWNMYDKIQIDVINQACKLDDPLILISLGPTASVLAYDLSNLGFQSLDIGHITNVYDKLMGSGIKPEEISIENNVMIKGAN
jgi:glycosyltransferase family protein